jgi:predicted MPP superfamily phosphohydrolase
MKVSELITILNDVDQDLPVFYATDIHDGWYLLAPQGIRIEIMELDNKDFPVCLIGEYP